MFSKCIKKVDLIGLGLVVLLEYYEMNARERVFTISLRSLECWRPRGREVATASRAGGRQCSISTI